MTLTELNALSIIESRARFELCCGAQRWIDGMLMRRPFTDEADLLAAGQDIWRVLDPKDWREAIGHHPHVAQAALLGARWPGVAAGGLARLQGLSDDYFARFGFAFLLADPQADPVGALESRLANDAEKELRVAADELSKMTAAKLADILKA
ncbi:MAG: decarboxylase [Elusimicrobia bacterium]|nr:decarboxylase [Elusimicrobiota bacterium]